MTTSTVRLPVRVKPHRVVRFIIPLLLAIVIASLLLSLYFAAHSALPQLDGEVRISGLTSRVTVLRDHHGMPTIDAAHLEDLFFAQGYVTAQDRLWQMDAMRRSAAGELSEILGPGQLEHDRQQRVLGLRAIARHSSEGLSPRDRAYLEAYARGVNAYIESHRDRLPIEFRILNFRPKPWALEDCLLTGANMVESLNHYVYKQALLREKILAAFGSELTADIFVNSTFHDRLPTDRPARLDEPAEDNSDQSKVASSVSEPSPSPFPTVPAHFFDFVLSHPGSNNWVIDGAHTVSGKPLLANDMHLEHQMPNLWYAVHLQSGSFDVVGVSLPGLPFVIVGHNQRIGWGFTNVGPNVEDVYIETFNDHDQYLTPQGWRAAEHRQELIHIKGRPDEVVDVLLTRHGPIITDLIQGEKRKLALRWTLYDGLHDPFFDIDAAQNWEQFLNALSRWEAPSQNTVYGDVGGHIGYHATGHIPIRASGDGSVPQNGSDDAHEWTGYIPFDKLPNVFDPRWGVLATANGRITAKDYPYSVSTGWEAPWRTERIYRVLDSGKKFAPPDMLALQTDVYSAFDRFCAERFVYALDHPPTLSPPARQARDLMRDWDGRMLAHSPAALIEYRSVEKLAQMLLEPKVKSTTKTDRDAAMFMSELHWSMSSVWLENILLKQPKRWLPEIYSDYNSLLSAAVEAAMNDPRAPANPLDWPKRMTFWLYIQHPLLGRIPIVRRWSGPGWVPQSGDGLSINQRAGNLGSSERLTVDFSDFDQSTLNLVTGEAGNFLSPYYMDQWKAWHEGFTFPLPFSHKAVEQSAAHKLVLQPAE